MVIYITISPILSNTLGKVAASSFDSLSLSSRKRRRSFVCWSAALSESIGSCSNSLSPKLHRKLRAIQHPKPSQSRLTGMGSPRGNGFAVSGGGDCVVRVSKKSVLTPESWDTRVTASPLTRRLKNQQRSSIFSLKTFSKSQRVFGSRYECFILDLFSYQHFNSTALATFLLDFAWAETAGSRFRRPWHTTRGHIDRCTGGQALRVLLRISNTGDNITCNRDATMKSQGSSRRNLSG
jgi:hypothetical protein